MGRTESRPWPGPPVFGVGRAAGKPCRYDAYVPDYLADRELVLRPETAADVGDAERAIQRLNDETPSVANLEALARLLLRAESVASSRIEGLQVGPRRLIRAEGAARMGVAPDDVTAEAILGNIRAMQLAVDQVATASSLSVNHVFEIHRTLMPELGGHVREQQNWIGGNDYNPCGADFVPPPAEHVPALLDDLVAFMNADDYPPLVQAALAHAQFETIHPFADGNGRTGRALIHVVLKRRGLAPRYVPPISLVLATRSRDYVRGLTAFRFVGPADSPQGQIGADEWIATFAAAAGQATLDAQRLGAQVGQLVQEWRARTAPFRAKSATDLLLRALPGAPVLTASTAARLIGRDRSIPNVIAAIDRLVQAGVLTQITVGRRNRAFEAVGLAELLTDFERSLASPGGDTRPPTRSVRSRRAASQAPPIEVSCAHFPRSAAVNVAAAVAEILKREGTEFLIGYPVNPIIEAAAEADIRTIIVRQERTGLHMADAVSRVTSGDRIGVFCMQHGPGTENAFGGVAQAYGDSVPLVVIPMGYPRRIANMPPNFSALLNFQNVSKWTEQVNLAVQAPESMRRAFTQVRNGRPRPAVIEIPTDVMSEEVPDGWDYVPTQHYKSGPDSKSVEEAARVLVEAKRPVIYAGQGVHYAKAWPQLRQLAELLEAPVTTSLEGKSAFPEDHQLYLGGGGRAHSAAVFHFLKESDVIFGVGCSFSQTNYGTQIPRGKTVIHATNDPADLNKDLEAQHALIGDADITLEALIAAVKDRLKGRARGNAGKVADEIKSVNGPWLQKWMPKLTSNETPLSPYRVIWDLLHTVDVRNTIVTHDAGSPRDQISPFWTSIEPLSYIGWGKTTQLGYGLGLAMGAKLAHPDKLCINVWGDAAIGFTGMDFETAVRERIPILSILLNNFCMAIELPIMKTATAKYRSTDISGNYADMAKAFGGYGERVTTPDQIVPAIKRGIEQTRNGKPALLEFITQQEIEFSVFR